MFRALKDGLKEFANDALKESAEIVKDTADGTGSSWRNHGFPGAQAQLRSVDIFLEVYAEGRS